MYKVTHKGALELYYGIDIRIHVSCLIVDLSKNQIHFLRTGSTDRFRDWMFPKPPLKHETSRELTIAILKCFEATHEPSRRGAVLRSQQVVDLHPHINDAEKLY